MSAACRWVALPVQAADLRDYVAAVDPFAESAEAARGSGPRGSLHLYDRVLLDAPCSGTGVLAKRADLRWRRQPADLVQLSSLQVTLGASTGSSSQPDASVWGSL